eukprot:scaffold22457_cov47-Attheya_sp.AAC.7
MSHITLAPPSFTRSPSGGFTWGFAGHAQRIQHATMMHAADVARYGVEGLRDEINKTLEVVSQTVDRQHDKATRNGLFCLLYFSFYCIEENLENGLLKASLYAMEFVVCFFLLKKNGV